MKIVGLITEYNPFHNGHEYHIQKALEITGADAALVVMSGNFVQRGTPAVFPKQFRARAALLNGAAAVLELPVCYSCGSAEYFAKGAISLLESLHCVDYLCFGSECGDLQILASAAEILAEEPAAYRALLRDYLKTGLSFPAARQMALCSYTNAPELEEVLSKPNNTLGIEYLKALYQLGSTIEPFTITRQESAYHDRELTTSFSSASAVRTALGTPGGLIQLRGQIPPSAYQLLEESKDIQGPLYANDFSLLLKYKLLSETKESLTAYADVSPELANRIINRRNRFLSWEQFCETLKTKELTYTRISRALLHIILDIRSDDMELFKEVRMAGYARLLGFKQSDGFLLSSMKANSTIPLITKLGQDELPPAGKRMLAQDIYAADLYQSVITEKYGQPFINELEQQLCIIM